MARLARTRVAREQRPRYADNQSGLAARHTTRGSKACGTRYHTEGGKRAKMIYLEIRVPRGFRFLDRKVRLNNLKKYV